MKQNLKSVKATAWKWMSLYVRKQMADTNGVCQCFTCKKWIDWKYEAEAGHFRSRRHESTMFDEVNVHVQCTYCNKELHGNEAVYFRRLNEVFGEGTAEGLIDKSLTPCHRNYNDFKTISDKYRKLYNDIK